MTSTQGELLRPQICWGVKHMGPFPLLELLCGVALIFLFQELFILSHMYMLSVQPECSLFGGQCHTLTYAPHSTEQCHLLDTERACNKFLFIDN